MHTFDKLSTEVECATFIPGSKTKYKNCVLIMKTQNNFVNLLYKLNKKLFNLNIRENIYCSQIILKYIDFIY